MFESIERLAGSDLKHGDRLRLENYAYFTESVWPLARSRGGGGFGFRSGEDEGQGQGQGQGQGTTPPSSSSLGPYLSQSEARQGEAMRVYVTQQLEWGRFYKLFEFSDKVERLLQVVGVEEVSFQPGCSASEVRSMIQVAMKDAPRKLGKMSLRVRKHLGASPLAFKAWGCILEQIVVKYSRLEEQVKECYPQVVFEPTSSQLAEIVEAAPGPGGD